MTDGDAEYIARFLAAGMLAGPVLQDRYGRWRSRIVHRPFNGSGRDATFRAHAAIGALLEKP